MAKILPNRKYTIAENLNIHRNSNGVPTTWSGATVLDYGDLDKDLDNRLGIVSFNNDYSFESYLVYYQLFADLVFKSRQDYRNRVLSLLDLGYVPAAVPPSFMAAEIHSQVSGVLKKLKIPYIEEEPMDYEGKRVDSPAKDIWVSRLVASEILGMDVMEINIVNIIRRVMNDESN